MVGVLGLLFHYLGFLLSPFGILALLMGVMLFIMIPVIPKLTNFYHSFARLHLFVATRMLKRAAFVVSEHGDLLLKRMKPDDIGTEKIAFADDTKEFEDPTSALHWWHGIPFALADEVHGILFDPRHAAIGKREHDLKKNNETQFKPTNAEQDQFEIIAWQNGVYEFARNAYEIVNLGMVRELITGSERAEHPQRVKTYYENSRAPYLTGSSTARWILIIVAAIAPFAVLWFIATQFSTGNTSTIGFGVLVLLFSATNVRATLKSVDWLHVIKFGLVSILVWAPLPLLYYFLYQLAGPIFMGMFAFTLGAGFWFIPLFCMLFRVSTTFADWASGFLFRLGFLGYDRPIFEWTPRQYRVRELSKMGDVDKSDAAWYGLAGNLIGFTFKPGPESWSMGLMENNELENATLDPSAKETPKTNLPSGYHVYPEMRRDVYAAVVPSAIKDACYYLHSGIILESLTYAATGEKSNKRLMQSKDEFGEDDGMAESRFGMTLALASIVSLALGVFVFFL